jgi:CheY-like chemotaxis protein
VLDVHMPGLDGFDVCRSLRAEDDPQLRDVPILILTGTQLEEAQLAEAGTQLEEAQLAEAFRAGATDFMVKPIKATLLRSRVRGWRSSIACTPSMLPLPWARSALETAARSPTAFPTQGRKFVVRRQQRIRRDESDSPIAHGSPHWAGMQHPTPARPRGGDPTQLSPCRRR